jgi:hypothetical protein
MTIIDYDRFEEVAIATRDAFAQADPFSHAIIDDFLEPAACSALLEEFDAIVDDDE